MPPSRSERRSACASVSCSSRWTLCRSMRYGVSQCPSTMMALRCSSLAEVLINPIDLSHQLLDVIEEEFCLAQRLIPEPAGAHRGDGKRHAMRGEHVVRRIADRESPLVVAA